VLTAGAMGFPFTHFFFFIFFAFCFTSFYRCVNADPGFVPIPADTEIKQALEDLVDQGRLNGTNFCIDCLVSHRRTS
jgi:hypothetical protein